MNPRLRLLTTLTALVLPLAGSLAPAAAVEYLPFVTVDAAPDGAKVAIGEHFQATEFSNSRPLSQGSVGPLPVFYADDEFGCLWTTATSSGITEWIGLAKRSVTTGSDHCGPFAQKMAAAQAAGADALILINNAPGTATATAAGTIPGGIIDQAQGLRLKDSLVAGNPNAVKITFGLLDELDFTPPGAIRPTTVDSLTAASSGSAVSVSGRAAFGGESPVTVAEDVAGDGPVNPERSGQLGVDLIGASISQPSPDDPTLVFEWKVTNLPSSGTLPEAIRYFWPFQVNTAAGPKQYMLQAKLSNLASSTTPDDPAGHVTHAGASFQLRGNCGVLVAINNCGHIAWLDGTFDVARDTVRMELPIGEGPAPEVVPGAKLERFEFSGGTIAAAYQAAVSNASTTDYANWEEIVYTVPSREVTLGVAPAGTDPGAVSYATAATVAEDSSFAGSVSTSGLAPGSYEVFARACFGNNCAVRTAPFTI